MSNFSTLKTRLDRHYHLQRAPSCPSFPFRTAGLAREALLAEQVVQCLSLSRGVITAYYNYLFYVIFPSYRPLGIGYPIHLSTLSTLGQAYLSCTDFQAAPAKTSTRPEESGSLPPSVQISAAYLCDALTH